MFHILSFQSDLFEIQLHPVLPKVLGTLSTLIVSDRVSAIKWSLAFAELPVNIVYTS